jgi:Fe-S-cluster containining protein
MAGCIQCGECCKKYGMRLEASSLDIARWTFDGRTDILSRVGIVREDGKISGGALWVDPDGSRVSQCPFLELHADGKYYCGIQETKPEVCNTHWCRRYIDTEGTGGTEVTDDPVP